MRGVWLVAMFAALAMAGSACSSGPPGDNHVAVSTGACGARWQHAAPGWRTFEVYNGAAGAADVELINPASGGIYAEIEAMGPATTRPMRIDLGSGSYAFRCLIEDTDAINGPVTRIPGDRRGTSAIVPVTDNDLLGPAREYHAYVAAGLRVLIRQTGMLVRDIRRGDLAAARAAWLPAHLTYERLGAAYGTFGNFDDEIDRRADGLAGGTASPDFTGFYRLEYGLWHGQRPAELRGPARRLDRAAGALRTAFPQMEVDLLDLGLRTHEILENALQFQLTGHDDYGSGTTLATTAANITGTRELLSILHPLLITRYRDLPAVYASIDRLQRLVDAERRPGGRWVPVRKLGTIARERIDAAAGQALEVLAPIAVILEPRRTQ